MTEREQEMIDEIMDNFDFDKVQRVMECINWKWVGHGVPDAYTLRQEARQLLKESVKRNQSISTGGFLVKKSKGMISLSFLVEDWHEEYE